MSTRLVPMHMRRFRLERTSAPDASMVVTTSLAGEPDHARPPTAIFRIVREVVENDLSLARFVWPSSTIFGRFRIPSGNCPSRTRKACAYRRELLRPKSWCATWTRAAGGNFRRFSCSWQSPRKFGVFLPRLYPRQYARPLQIVAKLTSNTRNLIAG